MKYIDSLRKYFSFYSDKRSKCELVLGTSAIVAKFSQFWDQNADSMYILSAAKMHDYITDNNPTPEEFAAYKKAQADIGGFFALCHKEVQEKKDST